jgi:hypothetical protein
MTMNRLTHRLFISGLLTGLLGFASGCGGGDNNPDAAPPPDAPPQVGTLNLSWQITDGVAGTLTCAEVAGSSVSIRATPKGGGTGVPSVLSCDSGSGSVTIPAGTYDVVITLITSNNSQLSEPQQFNDVEIKVGLQTAVGPLNFQVVPLGIVEFKIDTDSGASNCAPDTQGGAGMTDIYVAFHNADGECISRNFIIGEGATQPAGIFLSDCAGTTFGGCIENDQTIRLEGVSSGANSMVFLGYKNGVGCFARTSQFTVAGNNLTTTLITQLLVRTLIPACDPTQ